MRCGYLLNIFWYMYAMQNGNVYILNCIQFLKLFFKKIQIKKNLYILIIFLAFFSHFVLNHFKKQIKL